VLVVRTDAPYKTVADLVAKAKQEPGKLSFGSGSSSSRVAGEMFKQLTRTEILHVPYKSNPNAITDLLGGQIDFMITDSATGVPRSRAASCGRSAFRRLNATRCCPKFPRSPSRREGLRHGLLVRGLRSRWNAAPVVSRLRELLVAGTRSPAAKAFFDSTGSDAWTTTPEELGSSR
jgi:hypothetical protein